MNKPNYDKIMREIIDGLPDKPALYLHSCCAPCSTKCLEDLYPYFNITVVYYNPNIDEEIHKLLKEIEKLFKEKTNKKNYVKDEIFCSF